MNKPDILILSASWCSTCKELKRFLDDKKINYRTIDVEDDEGSKIVLEYSIKGVPVLILGNEIIVGKDNIINRIIGVKNE